MDLRTSLMVVVISSAIGLFITVTFSTVIHSILWRRDFGVWPWNDNWLKGTIKNDLHDLKVWLFHRE